MKLLEYEAKTLLAKAGVPVPRSFMAGEHVKFLPAVMKSQVPVGGRGKAGGIVVVKSDEEYQTAADKIVKLDIKGFLPQQILAEELLDIKKELYLSLLVDKAAAQIVVMANVNGGVEVEDNVEESFFRVGLGDREMGNRKVAFDNIGQELADYYDLPELTFTLQDLIEKLYSCFVENDALLLEINPLVVTADDHLVAGDCKMELDDAAAWRHPDWHFEAEKTETNFVTLDPSGVVATVANGAGLAMATVDAVADAGLTPANFLDVGGGANEASMLAAFKRLMDYPNLKVIIINIFAGISRCDEVARAIIAARDQIADLPPLAIRLAGTNYEEAASLLAEHRIEIKPSLAKAIESARGYVE
jgi:succinyl-CoA synthetase beta subunit